MRVKRPRRWIAVAVPAALYVGSLCLPSYELTRPGSVGRAFDGYRLFREGLRRLADLDGSLLAHVQALPWLANPAVVVALGFLAAGRRRAACRAAAVAWALALGALAIHWYVLFDEPMYWCWSSSAIAAFLAGWFVLEAPRPPMATDYGPMTPDP